MDTQDIWTASLLVPAVVLGTVTWVARRRGRTTFGLGLRDGAVGEFARGAAFSVPFFLLLLAVYDLSGLTDGARWLGGWGSAVGIAVYFLVLFGVEELAFRSLFMTGLGVLAGRTVALLVTAVLVAGAYLFAPHSSALVMVGAVVTNVLTGLARWRSGRIWWGYGQRWLWNSALVAFGFDDSAYHLDDGLMRQPLHAAAWLTGDGFGVEGGVVGIVFQVVMLALVWWFASGRTGPWTVVAVRDVPSRR